MPVVGDTVYQFDINHRVYALGASGRAQGGPIFQEHFRPCVIVGEEKRSWMVTVPGVQHARKVAKDKLLTAEQVDERCWLEDHGHKVAQLVDRCQDVALLKEIGALLGYPPALASEASPESSPTPGRSL